MMVITNNPKVKQEIGDKIQVNLVEGSYFDVLIAVRDRIHGGQTLLTHPLSGSVKPNETPYKSIAIDETTGELDLRSLTIIEDSIATYEKMNHNNSLSPIQDEKTLEDFREVDGRLLMSAVSRWIE